MAEVGVAASLIGIATFGIQLTTTLYNFGATASSAREHTDYIARHVALYADVLELLARRIDDDEPIHSHKALDLDDEIYDQSHELFENVRSLLPDRADKISFMQKIKWNFKKTKVDLLVSEIEYMKTTVSLLVNILYAGKKLRASKRKRRSKKAGTDAKLQFAKAQNAIVDQMNAATTKEQLQAKVEEDDEEVVHVLTDKGGQRVSSALIKHTPQITHFTNNVALVHFNESLRQAKTSSEQRALVMQNSVNLLKDLLDQWTTLAEETNHANEDVSNAARDPEPSPFSENPGRQSRGMRSKSANPGDALSSHEPLEHATTTYGPTANLPDTRYTTSIAEKYAALQKKIRDLEDQLATLKSEKSRMEGNEEFHGVGVMDPYENRDPYDGKPQQPSAQKHVYYEDQVPPPPESSEKLEKPIKSASYLAADWAAKLKAQAEESRASRADERRLAREKWWERTEKAQNGRPAIIGDRDMDDIEIRAYMKIAQPKTRPYSDRPAERSRISQRTDRARALDEECIDERRERYDRDFERHHQESRILIDKATTRPSLERAGPDAYKYWAASKPRGGRESSSDNKKRPVRDETRTPPFTDKSKKASTR